MCVCFLFFQAMVLNPKRPVGLSEETKGKFNSAVSNWTQKSQQLRLVICLLLYTVPWENELGTCQWISRILQLRINDGQSSPHRSLSCYTVLLVQPGSISLKHSVFLKITNSFPDKSMLFICIFLSKCLLGVLA